MSQNLNVASESDTTLIIPPVAAPSPAGSASGAGAADDAESRKPAAARHRQAPAESLLAHDKPHGRPLRVQYPIAAYVGVNGSGKTLLMVHDTLLSLVQGRDIYTTVPLHLPDDSIPGNVHILHDWSQVLNAQHADILLDEVSAIASARETEALPPQIATLLQQLRKRDLLLRWTAPNWMRADRILRETTRLITICRGMFPRKVDGAQWKSNSFFRFISYDAADYTDFSSLNSTRRALKPLQTNFMRLSKCCAKDCYDTYDSVSTIGTVLMSGRCAVCGGRRRVPDCTCADYKALMHRK